MEFCNKCGKSLAPGQMFCDGCGAKHEVITPTPIFAVPENTKSLNILLIISAVLMALGTMLPCYTVSFLGHTESIAYLSNSGEIGDGIFVLLAAVAVVVLAVLKKDKFAVIPAAISIIMLINFCSEGFEITNYGMGSFGIGTYVMWIGSIAACVTPFIKKK